MNLKISNILIAILIIPIAFATQGIITEVDFSLQPERAFILGDADGISFIINEKEYVISIDEIGRESIRVQSFFYNEDGSREVLYIPLNGQYSYKIDYDKDDVYDLKVDFLRIEDDGRAVVIFERISENKYEDDQITSETVTNTNFINTQGIIITILIVLAGVIAYFVFRKK